MDTPNDKPQQEPAVDVAALQQQLQQAVQANANLNAQLQATVQANGGLKDVVVDQAAQILDLRRSLTSSQRAVEQNGAIARAEQAKNAELNAKIGQLAGETEGIRRELSEVRSRIEAPPETVRDAAPEAES